MTRGQHHRACRGYLPGRIPWRPFQCGSCDAIDRALAAERARYADGLDAIIHQHGRGENP